MDIRCVPWRRRSRTLTGRFAPGLALLALGACEVPTSLPEWDTLWIAPGQSTTISVASLLPGQVSVTGGGDAFQLDVAPVSFQESLGEACPACALANGFTLPKPAFTLEISATAPLPSDVVTANLASGQVAVALTHNFGFDPLRPSASARGYLVLTARSGTTTLVRDSISGNDLAWPQGSTINRTLSLSPAVIASGVEVAAKLYSPAGDPVKIDTNQRLSLTATPTLLRASEAKVHVTNQAITVEEVDLDLEDIDDVVVDHQKGGALLLDISNPFDVTGNLALTITAPGTTINRQLALKTGDFTARIELSESDLSSILGRSPVRLSATGSVSGPAGGVTVKPSQNVDIDSRLELTIGPKEGQ